MFDQDTVFVDLETTGGNAIRDRITEIAIISMQSGKLVSEWSSLINPQTYIPETIQRLTGIDNEMVSDKPTFHELYDEIYQRLNGSVFVAHNARFDYGFLKNEFKRCSKEFRAPVLCTVKLSRLLFPEFRRHNLDSILKRHGLQCTARHRALGDARVIFDFMKNVYATVPALRIENAITKILRRPSLPATISEDDIDRLPESPGVYLFYDKQGVLLYIGKSVNLRSRVMSHFSGDHRSSKDMKISQNIDSLEFIETAGELGALLLEAKLIKDQLPVYNHRLRRHESLTTIQWEFNDLLSIPKIITEENLDPNNIINHYGLFKTKRKAKNTLISLAKEYQLCHKRLGLEKGNGACFAFQLKQCRGVCAGKEPELQHQMRISEALHPIKNKTWPFNGRIGIREISDDQKIIDIHVFENWCYLYTAKNEIELQQTDMFKKQPLMFDIDTYQILNRYFNKNSEFDRLSL